VKGNQQRGFNEPPKLLPAGSVNRVLLLGGKNLTVFQSVALMFIGVCVAGGIGIPVFLTEFSGGSSGGDHLDALYLLLAMGLLIVWGAVMFVNGLRSLAKRLHGSKRASV
jgi:membrane protein CcdC involved in cytochrome C biogenesis